MQMNDIKQRFSQFEQCVETAMQTCQQESNVPPQLADNIRQLDREVHNAHDMILNAQQESPQLVQCIDRLEQMGDDAEHACESAPNLSQRMQNAVQDLHSEISSLKRQLH